MSHEARLLSAFTVQGPTADFPKGRLIPFQGDAAAFTTPGRLRNYEYDTVLGRRYEENHLEEWIARCPQALFPDQAVDVLASQNHAFLPEKVDLLFLLNKRRFTIAEVKAERVAASGGESPHKLYHDQLARYVSFLSHHLANYPESHRDYYRRFSEEFFGHREDPPLINAECIVQELNLHEVIVAEGFDKGALDYLQAQATKDGRGVQLIEYRFFGDRQYIEFWDYPFNGRSSHTLTSHLTVKATASGKSQAEPQTITSIDKLGDREMANRVFLVGHGDKPQLVQWVYKLNMSRKMSINKYNMLDQTRETILGRKQPAKLQEEMRDTIARGHEVAYRGFDENDVDNWIAYGKDMAARHHLKLQVADASKAVVKDDGAQEDNSVDTTQRTLNGNGKDDGLQKVIAAWPKLNGTQKQMIFLAIQASQS